MRGLKYVTATQASLVGMLEPVANPIWVFLFLGERPGVYAIAGGAIVLGAIAWRTLGPPGPPAVDRRAAGLRPGGDGSSEGRRES